MGSKGDFHSSFVKYEKNPVFGDERTGTTFDVYVTRENGRYRMDFSQRRKRACAVTFSRDGISWEEPVVTLAADQTSGWEDEVNRNCVLKINGQYQMWYTGQARGHSFIGYAQSDDGITFHRIQKDPVMIPEYPWEKDSVMNPCVLYENGRYRMWYSAGETYEPNVLAYAESKDGIYWEKAKINPIFVKEESNFYEKDRIGGCQVIQTQDMGYVMFYIGYEDIDTARICVARSEDGITGWIRSGKNPLVSPQKGAWDQDACYKPSVVWDGEKWMLWYNGRTAQKEYVGLAQYFGRNLF